MRQKLFRYLNAYVRARGQARHLPLPPPPGILERNTNLKNNEIKIIKENVILLS
jgi:hypothetical protein